MPIIWRVSSGLRCSACRRYIVLEVVFVLVLKWGVVGAALAPAIAQYFGLAVMLGLLIREKALLPEHCRQLPSLASVVPLLRVRIGFLNRCGSSLHDLPLALGFALCVSLVIDSKIHGVGGGGGGVGGSVLPLPLSGPCHLLCSMPGRSPVHSARPYTAKRARVPGLHGALHCSSDLRGQYFQQEGWVGCRVLRAGGAPLRAAAVCLVYKSIYHKY